jgi:hypothetical protein
LAAVGTDLDQVVQIGLAADPLQRAALGHLIGNRDRIDGLAAREEIHDRVIDHVSCAGR